MEKQLTATIKKLNKSGYLKEFTEGDTEFRVYNEGVISSIKSGIQRVINSLKNFCIKHARVCQYVCTALSVVMGVVSVKHGSNVVKSEKAVKFLKNQVTDDVAVEVFNDDFRQQMMSNINKSTKKARIHNATVGARNIIGTGATAYAASKFKKIADDQDRKKKENY